VLAASVSLIAIVCIAGFPNPRKQRRADHQVGDPTASCGPVSLAVVGALLGKPVSIKDFHDASGSGELGVCSMADLLRALRARGFAARGLRYHVGSPPKHQLPMVLFLDGNHFLAAQPAPDGSVVLVDLPSEPRKVDWSSLADIWSGESLVVAISEMDLETALAAR